MPRIAFRIARRISLRPTLAALLCGLALATPVAAQPLEVPGYWRVTGVAADDALNVRAGPGTAHEVIGALPPDTTGVEVDLTQGGWARIVWFENNGWVSTRYLAPDPQPTVADTPLPVGLRCGGVEPFWSLNLDAEAARFDDIAGAEFAAPLRRAEAAEGYFTPILLTHAAEGAEMLTVIAPAACSDSMADRVMPWRAELLLQEATGRRFLTGCCWLPLALPGE